MIVIKIYESNYEEECFYEKCPIHDLEEYYRFEDDELSFLEEKLEQENE